MTENDRTRRSPKAERTEDSEPVTSGHDLIDGAARRTDREDPAPKSDEPEVRRTRRTADSSSNEEPTGRSSREVGSRTNLSGNTSETGAGSPTPEQTGTRQVPGKPPAGCSTSTGVFLLLIGALGVAVNKLIRR